jgi:hypothetical protein
MDDPAKWDITEELLRKASYSNYFRAIRNFLKTNGFLPVECEKVIMEKGKTRRGFPPVPRMYSVQHYEKAGTIAPPLPLPSSPPVMERPSDKKILEGLMGRPALKEIPKVAFPPDTGFIVTPKGLVGIGTKGAVVTPDKDILEEVRTKLNALKSGLGTAGNLSTSTTDSAPPVPPKPVENPFDRLRRSLLTQRGFFVETPHTLEAK